MSHDCLKLTIYFGERDRVGGRFLADVLTDLYARHRLRTSLVMRGVEGFGFKHHLHTDRHLTLSEDLPLISVAVDLRSRVRALLPELAELRFDGLVTLERTSMSAQPLPPDGLSDEPDEATKLTVYVGRRERAAGRPVHEAVVDLLHRRGIAGALVLLGIDGTAHGRRHRARFFSSNAAVPLMVIGVGASQQIGQLLPALGSLLTRPLVTLERVRVCKQDGEFLASPHQLPDTDPGGLGIWQKLTVYAPEQARSDGHPLHGYVVRELRRAGASGASTLRSFWGYGPTEEPHGDTLWQLRRRLPALTVAVDTPQRIRRWFALVDQLTRETGMVTSEIVPAYRATGPDLVHGGLRLSRPGRGLVS